MKSLLILITIFFSFLSNFLFCQEKENCSDIEKVMSERQLSKLKTIDEIATFISNKYASDNDKLKAAFVWISANIYYDIKMLEDIEENDQRDEIPLADYALKNRSGVCKHFAMLFKKIDEKMGYRSFCISGYTKENGKIAKIGHVWCAVEIQNEWYLFDPTWGSGYIDDDRYIKKLNYNYFMISPDSLIKTHIPFDPIWQLRPYRITYQDFQENKLDNTAENNRINCSDSIAVFMKLSRQEKLEAQLLRINANGTSNNHVAKKVKSIKSELEYLNDKKNDQLMTDIEKRSKKVIFYYSYLVKHANEGFKNVKSIPDFKNAIDSVNINNEHIEAVMNSIKFSSRERNAQLIENRNYFEANKIKFKKLESACNKFLASKENLK